MKESALFLVLFLSGMTLRAIVDPQARRMDTAYTISYNGQSVKVGPFHEHTPNWSHCKDWCGSALFLHPQQCFQHPSDFNCRIIGNGFFFPSNTPFPRPANEGITADCSCLAGSGADANLKSGYYFPEYTPTLIMKGPYGSENACVKRRKVEKLAGHMVGTGICQGIGDAFQDIGPMR